MNSRERIFKALNHEESDKVPYDLGSTQLTGISVGAYRNLRNYLGLPDEKIGLSDSIQQLAMPSEDLLETLEVDTRGLFSLTSHNWNVEEQLQDAGSNWEYHDEWGLTYHFPKENGHWYTLVKNPLADITPDAGAIEAYSWPEAKDKRRIEGLREKAIQYRNQGKVIVFKGLCAGLFEMMQRIRGMENALMDPMLYLQFSDLLIGKLADLKIEFWQMALRELHDVVDIVVEADDYGTQTSQLISPDQFRQVFKPHLKRVLEAIKIETPDAYLFFHSCGSVRSIIPDFIEMGVDILNPVHIRAEGMEPKGLKKDFGHEITFWGGGVDTQGILPNGTPEEVADDVKRNIEALSPGGGFVFNTVHNIQSEVPVENIMAMWKTLQEYGIY
ncbi:MAG: uroporphyrinogen decarboxylase family protein [Bacteroidota bacterium]